MKLKLKQQRNSILSITNTSIMLIDIIRDNDGRPNQFVYSLNINVDVNKAFALNAKTLVATIFNKKALTNVSTWRSTNKSEFITSSGIVNDLLTSTQITKSDIINNSFDIISTAKIGIQHKQQLNEHNKNKKISVIKNIEKKDIIPNSLLPGIIYDATLDDGIDITTLYSGAESTFNSTFAGLVNKTENTINSQNFRNITNAINSIFNSDNFSNDLSSNKIETNTQNIKQQLILNINADNIRGYNVLHVNVKLTNTDNISIDQIEFDIEHAHQVSNFEIPVIPPFARVTHANAGRNIIDIKQYDKNAIAIKIYRRTLNGYIDQNNTTLNSYEYITEIPIRNIDKVIKIIDTVNNNNTLIYRFVCVGYNGSVSKTFSSVVIKGMLHKALPKRRRLMNVAFTVEKNADAVDVTVTNICTNVISVSLQKRLAGTTDFENISNTIIIANNNTIKFTDFDVKNNAFYEYRIVMHNDDGIDTKSSYIFYEHVSNNNRGIQINITNPVITTVKQTNNVEFSLTSDITQTDDDVLYTALSELGVADSFANELTDIRNNFSAIVAHGIKRIRLDTGYIEDFGIIATNNFSDVDLGKKKNISQLIPGVNYRYMISTYIRSPEALFSKFKKVETSTSKFDASIFGKTNLSTKKYEYSPAKFKHPSVAIAGTISNQNTRALQQGKNELSYGALGNTQTIDVIIPVSTVNILSVTANYINADKIAINWKINGNEKLIDHFVVICNNNETKRFVCTAHALDTTIFEFQHDVSKLDRGPTSYTVIIIGTNFGIITTLKSNTIMVT